MIGKIRKLRYCWAAYRQYWRTPKGRHDLIDYLRALLIFAACALGALWAARKWFG